MSPLEHTKRRMDYELPELLSNLEADIALFEDAQDPGDLVDALLGIRQILMKITGNEE